MLDIGWSELVLIGVVALIVVGPKDLPRMFHALGRFTAKARGMAREFQSAMNDAAKSAGLEDVRKDLRDLTSKKSLGIDALETAASKFEKWDPTKSTIPAQGPATQALATKVAAESATRMAARNEAARSEAALAEATAPASTIAAPGTVGAPPAETKLEKPAAKRRKTAVKVATAPPVAASAAAAAPKAPRRKKADT